jgi:hypothetical protein
MTAKSETVGVVAWEVVRHDRNDKESRSVVLSPLTDDTNLDDGDEAFALMRVEDHESALAELFDSSLKAQSVHTATVAELHAAEARLTTLLSGLEALAGELERDGALPNFDREDEGYATAQRDLAKRIRALIPAAANTESEEVK